MRRLFLSFLFNLPLSKCLISNGNRLSRVQFGPWLYECHLSNKILRGMVLGCRGMFRHKIEPNKALAPGGFYYRQPCYRRRVTGYCSFLDTFFGQRSYSGSVVRTYQIRGVLCHQAGQSNREFEKTDAINARLPTGKSRDQSASWRNSQEFEFRTT